MSLKHAHFLVRDRSKFLMFFLRGHIRFSSPWGRLSIQNHPLKADSDLTKRHKCHLSVLDNAHSVYCTKFGIQFPRCYFLIRIYLLCAGLFLLFYSAILLFYFSFVSFQKLPCAVCGSHTERRDEPDRCYCRSLDSFRGIRASTGQ